MVLSDYYIPIIYPFILNSICSTAQTHLKQRVVQTRVIRDTAGVKDDLEMCGEVK